MCPLLLANHVCSYQSYKGILQDQGAPHQEAVTHVDKARDSLSENKEFTSLPPSSIGHVSTDERERYVYDTCEPTSASGTQENWEFSRDNVNIVKEIGKGAFAQVAKAEAWNISGVKGVTIVAVKMLKRE